MTTPDALWEVELSLAVDAAEAASFIVITQQRSHEGSLSDRLKFGIIRILVTSI